MPWQIVSSAQALKKKYIEISKGKNPELKNEFFNFINRRK